MQVIRTPSKTDNNPRLRKSRSGTPIRDLRSRIMALISFAASIRRRLRAVRSTLLHRDAVWPSVSKLATVQPALDERHIIRRVAPREKVLENN